MGLVTRVAEGHSGPPEHDPKIAPTTLVAALVSAPQNMTRRAPWASRAPPADAPEAPRTAKARSVDAATDNPL